MHGENTNSTEVSVERLKKALSENKTKHRKVFLLALQEYRRAAIRHFETNIQLAKESKAFYIHPPRDLVIPTDHTVQYEEALEMLEWETRKTIGISKETFRNYVLDKWEWSACFLSNRFSATASRVLLED